MCFIDYAHNGLISNLDLFRICEAIFNARAFKFDTDVIASATFKFQFF